MATKHRQNPIIAVLTDEANKINSHVLKELLLLHVQNLKQQNHISPSVGARGLEDGKDIGLQARIQGPI